ncbi:MAG: PTS sugar transporter subunit IIA [Balneolaceae bacterium]|nr:PTS sugar transporter subunit IIA [Balneolaceae bacterium]
MNIVSLLNTSSVLPGLKAGSKEEVLEKLIDTLKSQVNPGELEKIREAVMEREQIMSTGVGKGLAIPHGKAAGIENNYAAFALLEEPVDYQSIDGEPVSMVFLLVGPKGSNSLHIKTLSRISRLMNNADFRRRLEACDDAAEILEVFEEQEQVRS